MVKLTKGSKLYEGFKDHNNTFYNLNQKKSLSRNV